MDLLSSLSYSNLMNLLFNALSVVGLLYASVSSLWISDLEVLNRSYSRNPVVKYHEYEGEKQILNIPISIVRGNIKESTSLFIGFITTFLGIMLDMLIDTEAIGNKKLFLDHYKRSSVYYIEDCRLDNNNYQSENY